MYWTLFLEGALCPGAVAGRGWTVTEGRSSLFANVVPCERDFLKGSFNARPPCTLLSTFALILSVGLPLLPVLDGADVPAHAKGPPTFLTIPAMKLALVSAVALPALVSAHGVRDLHHVRQQAPASSSSSVAAPAPSSAAAGSSAPAATTAAPAATQATLTFTLASTNPSALPLSELASGATTQPTVAASTTYAAGSTPTFLSGAPALPSSESPFFAALMALSC